MPRCVVDLELVARVALRRGPWWCWCPTRVYSRESECRRSCQASSTREPRWHLLSPAAISVDGCGSGGEFAQDCVDGNGGGAFRASAASWRFVRRRAVRRGRRKARRPRRCRETRSPGGEIAARPVGLRSQRSLEPRGVAVRLVLGAERLREDTLLASGTDNLNRDQNGPYGQRLPALQRQQDEQKSHGAEDIDGVAKPRVEARRHELTCLRPDRKRHAQLSACDEPENGASHREAERHEPEWVMHVGRDPQRQENQIEQEHDGIDRSEAWDHVGRRSTRTRNQYRREEITARMRKVRTGLLIHP